MFVIGTAGHVDHGKSTLVHALSGINPDRLREEQERQMTLDLGFAWFRLPSGREVSVIDVPGHEDFINNMLAGVGGIDIAMLVVAADEAVMPQTREHLAILNLLHVPHGVVALTKADLISDPEWLDLVQEEVREYLQDTIFSQAAIIPVSAVLGTGISELKQELDRLLDQAEPRPDIGRPRLPIDRAFTISGFGTVVTGTLLDGRLRVGDEVELVPSGIRSRIRNLQTHKTRTLEAIPGTRVAVNLTGIEPSEIERGQVLATPGLLAGTMLLDAWLELLPASTVAIEHNMELDLHTGAAQTLCRVRLLDTELLEPGSAGWVQLRLAKPIAVVRGDRFIIRSASLNQTVGGGIIVQTMPGRRYRRFQQDVLERLQALLRGTPEDLVLQTLRKNGVCDVKNLLAQSGVSSEEGLTALWELLQRQQVVALQAVGDKEALLQTNPALMDIGSWHMTRDAVVRSLQEFEQRSPLALGMPREELKNRLKLAPAFANQVLEYAIRTEVAAQENGLVHRPEWKPVLTNTQQQTVRRVLDAFEQAGYNPPPTNEVETALGAELLTYLVQTGELLRAGDNVLFSVRVYNEMEQRVIEHLRTHEHITVAEVRDMFGTSRKYALGLLEEMDSRRVTRRLGDFRVLRARDRSTSAPDG